MKLINYLAWKIYRATSKQSIITRDVRSPSDIVRHGDIVWQPGQNKIEINLNELRIPWTGPPKVWIPFIPDTNSMDPVFDFEHNNILIQGANKIDQEIMLDFIKVGDIAVYRIPADEALPATVYSIHRIIKIEHDAKGRFFKFKGDNNYSADPYVLRDENIRWLVIGTIF